MAAAKNDFKTTQLLYRALLFGQAIFLGVAIYLRQTNLDITLDENTDRIFQVAALVLSITAVFAGYKLFRQKISVVREGNFSVDEKLKLYRAAAIVQWALTEGACLFAMVGYLLTGNWAFVGLAVLLLFIFAGYFPTKNKVAQQLGLDETEL